ncbi:MAG: M50 family metallopeptidase [Defluviitaleaceae bacterium]|nr:M50 family metallopeptidase [Defluviitaleaceae bacterium]
MGQEICAERLIVLGVISLIIFILIFGLLIFVHELGHFAAARRCGILVEEFAFGMGPKLVSWKPGETLFSIRLFPVGGFCSMHGMEDDSDSERSFVVKSIPARMFVILAGSAMNLGLALIIFALGTLTSGFNTTTISNVLEGSPAESAGLLPGDQITGINGSTTHIYGDVLISIRTSTTDTIGVDILREGTPHRIDITPGYNNGNRWIGVLPTYSLGAFQPRREGFERAGFVQSSVVGVQEMVFFIRHNFTVLGQIITGRASMDMMTGPIGIFGIIDTNLQSTVANAELLERSTSDTLLAILRSNLAFAGMLSAAIGIFNLLPFPALDGGRFVFLTLEGVRRKPIKPETEGTIHFVGFAMLMALAVFIAYRDVISLL